jgi:hypothetical protein
MASGNQCEVVAPLAAVVVRDRIAARTDYRVEAADGDSGDSML